MTDTELTTALNSAFANAGIDTPEKVGAFISIAALQVRKNSQAFELQKLAQTQQAEVIAQEQARQAKQAEIAATDAAILALIAAQAQ